MIALRKLTIFGISLLVICGCASQKADLKVKPDQTAIPESNRPYIGLSEADAKALAKKEGRRFRVSKRDEEDFTRLPSITLWDPTRINVVIVNDKVISCALG